MFLTNDTSKICSLVDYLFKKQASLFTAVIHQVYIDDYCTVMMPIQSYLVEDLYRRVGTNVAP